VKVVGELNLQGGLRRIKVASIGPAPTTTAEITPTAVSGSQPTLVILVKYNDIATEPHTNSYFVQDIFTSTTSLNTYYQENSFGIITALTGTVVGWNVLPRNYAYYNSCVDGAADYPCYNYLRNDAVNTVTGVSWSSYTRLIIVVNSDLGCGCAFAFIGPILQSTPGGTFSYSESFIPDDGWGATAGHGFGVIAHEYGHGLGLYHSGDNYNSLWDVMSGGTYASTGPVHTIGYHKIRLGWVTGTGIQTVSSGTYALNVIVNQLETSAPPSGVLVVKVMTSTSTAYYTIEVRKNIGYDAGLPSSGVIIHYVNETLSDWNAKVVMPSSGSICVYPCSAGASAAWQVGQTFIDSTNGIKIVLKSSTSTSFTLDVNPPPTAQITFVLNSVGGDATGTVLTVDSSAYQVTQFPLTLALTLTTHTVSATTTIPAGSGKQYVWLSWSDSQPASHQITVTGAATYTINYKTQFALSIVASPSTGGTTNPSPSGSPYWEDANTQVLVTETPNSGYSFYYWSLDGTNVGSGTSYSVTMNTAHTLTAYFRGSTSLTLSLSSNSISLQSSVTLSGILSPTQTLPGIPSGATIVLTYSLGGASYTTFITTTTASGGTYSATWYPPYPGTYSLRASWGGDQNYVGSTSNVVTLSVTGSLAPQPQLLLSGPSSTVRGGTATYDVLVTNLGASTLSTTVYLEVIGPNGYYYSDWLQVSVGSGSNGRYHFDWQVASYLATGTYTVTVGLIPPETASISQIQVLVS
jgi:M6 family metalloprotease-like protein